MYYEKKLSDDHKLREEIDRIYEQTPIYGYRRITVALREKGSIVNHKKVQRIMQAMNRKAIYPKKKTSIKNPEHKTYPYLLRNLTIDRPNQAWQVDITYIKIRGGTVYLTCLVDVFSRKIMGWELSTFLDTAACLRALDKALLKANPEIINSDQGCQFTSSLWIDKLKQNNISISMDGKGRWVDNVYIERLWRTIKQEALRLFSCDTVKEVKKMINEFILFYNVKRYHQALNYHTPDMIHQKGIIPSKRQLFMSFDEKNNMQRREASMHS